MSMKISLNSYFSSEKRWDTTDHLYIKVLFISNYREMLFSLFTTYLDQSMKFFPAARTVLLSALTSTLFGACGSGGPDNSSVGQAAVVPKFALGGEPQWASSRHQP